MIHLDFHLLFIVHHYDFINTPDDMVVCNLLGFMAWRHHYHKSDTFTKFWLQYRMSYFDYRMWCTIALESLVEYSLGFQYWWLNAMFQHTWLHIEVITHEWYHIPLEKRSTYFHLPPVTWLWFFMECIGMIDTVKHSGHHGHEITNQLDADDFFDMWVPSFMLRLQIIFGDQCWRSSISLSPWMLLWITYNSVRRTRSIITRLLPTEIFGTILLAWWLELECVAWSMSMHQKQYEHQLHVLELFEKSGMSYLLALIGYFLSFLILSSS